MSKPYSLLPPMYGISSWSEFERVFAEKLSRLKMAGFNLARFCSGNVLGHSHSHSGMSRQNSAAVSSKATLSMVALSRSTFAD